MYFMTIFSFFIRTISNVINIYNCCHTTMKIQFFLINLKIKLAKIFFFLIKFIYNILCIIKNYIEFGNYYFLSSNQTSFSNPIFSTLQSKTLKKISQKLIKLNKTKIQNKKETEK